MDVMGGIDGCYQMLKDMDMEVDVNILPDYLEGDLMKLMHLLSGGDGWGQGDLSSGRVLSVQDKETKCLAAIHLSRRGESYTGIGRGPRSFGYVVKANNYQCRWWDPE